MEVDADGAVQEFSGCSARGTAAWRADTSPLQLARLQHHASPPASATVIDEVDLALPFGTEACWSYTVGTSDEGFTFWFAKRRAGMPVQVEERVGGELVSRSVMIEDDVA